MTSITNQPGPDRWGVLLLAHGAPERVEDIPEFLLNVRGGRKLPDAAVEEIARRYRLIGGGSPLLRITKLQARALEEALKDSAANGPAQIPVYVGMRNWKPFIREAIAQIAADQVSRVVALCLAPHNSRTSTGLYRSRLDEAKEKIAPRLLVDFVENWHDEPGLILAFQEKLSRALDLAQETTGKSVPVIFSAHSVPERTIAEGDPYERQVRETVAAITGKMPLANWRVAFQSQGMTPEPWTGPTVESQIDELAAAGHRHILIAPIGFVSDHVEILYDIDVFFRDYGAAKGVAISRTESLNDSPLFIQALKSIVMTRLWPHIRSAGSVMSF